MRKNFSVIKGPVCNFFVDDLLTEIQYYIYITNIS